MSSHGGGWIHGAYDLDLLDAQELQIGVIEAIEGQQLLQEGDEHARVVFVGFGQVDVFEEKHHAVTLTRTVHPPGGGGSEVATGLDFLDHIHRGGLRTAVEGGDCSALPLPEDVVHHHTLTTPLRSDDNEWLHAVKPALEYVEVALQRHSADDEAGIESFLVQRHRWLLVAVADELATHALAVQRFANVWRSLVCPAKHLSAWCILFVCMRLHVTTA